MNDDQILDLPLDDQDAREHVKRHLTSNGKRFANMLIDGIAVYALTFLFGFIWGATISYDSDFEGGFFALIYLSGPLYYWVMESLTGKTIGKFVTRTKIVKEDGTQPTGINVLGRTLCLYLPDPLISLPRL